MGRCTFHPFVHGTTHVGAVSPRKPIRYTTSAAGGRWCGETCLERPAVTTRWLHSSCTQKAGKFVSPMSSTQRWSTQP